MSIHEKCWNALRIVESQVEPAQSKNQEAFLNHLTISLMLFMPEKGMKSILFFFFNSMAYVQHEIPGMKQSK